MFDLEIFIQKTNRNTCEIDKFFNIENSLIKEQGINEQVNDKQIFLNECPQKENNYFMESLFIEISGQIKFYKKNFDNISITNTLENFRYLPINRKNMVKYFQ